MIAVPESTVPDEPYTGGKIQVPERFTAQKGFFSDPSYSFGNPEPPVAGTPAESLAADELHSFVDLSTDHAFAAADFPFPDPYESVRNCYLLFTAPVLFQDIVFDIKIPCYYHARAPSLF